MCLWSFQIFLAVLSNNAVLQIFLSCPLRKPGVCASYWLFWSISIDLTFLISARFCSATLKSINGFEYSVALIYFYTNWSDFSPEPGRLGRPGGPGGRVQWGELADDRLHGWQGLGDRLGRLQDNHTLIILKTAIFLSKDTWTWSWSNLRFAFSFHIKQCDLENYSE